MSDLGGSTSPGSGDAGRSGPSAPASSAASIGPASALPSYHKKKRFHGVTAARRAGHGVPGNSSSGTFGDGEDDAEGDVAEGAFISSSRDASEEDNDEASGFSDSASSLRQHSTHPSAASNALPTTARDRALVDSKQAHRRPSGLVPPATDKTPSSASPPPTANAMTAETRDMPGAFSQQHTGTTLAEASAVLSAQDTGAVGSTPSERAADTEAASGRSEKPLSLGALPTADSPGATITTPKAHDQPAHAPSQARRKSPLTSNAPTALAMNRGSGDESDDEAVDTTAASPYDGDVEFAARSPAPQAVGSGGAVGQGLSSLPPSAASGPSLSVPTHATAYTAPNDVQSRPFISKADAANLTRADAALDSRKDLEKPVPMATPQQIRSFIHKAIYEPDPARTYRINHAPDEGKNPARPIRIYADGVYDLFHYAHALQLRQAKLMFPCVHLIVGVVSSDVCASHKNLPVMTSSERYTAVRNCRWVDEVVEDAPWVITQEVIDKLNVDYVAHDELPYAGAGSSAEMADVYHFVKNQGRFLPTQRTEGVSTSELLARIVEQYRNHNYDKKLAKIGHQELAFE